MLIFLIGLLFCAGVIFLLLKKFLDEHTYSNIKSLVKILGLVFLVLVFYNILSGIRDLIGLGRDIKNIGTEMIDSNKKDNKNE